jgi:hypothetical protein
MVRSSRPSADGNPPSGGCDDIQDQKPIVIYPASGTGAWEAAL